MKTWIACASALVLAAACGSSKEATQALEAMNLSTGSSGIVHYASKSGSGDSVTLKDVVLGDGSGNGLKAKSMVLAGLNVTKDGKPIVKSITVKDMTMEKPVPGLTFNLGTVSLTNANDVVGQFMAAAFTKDGPGNPPAFKDWEFAKLSMNGLKVSGDLKAMGAAPGGKFTVSMDELSASDLKQTIFGAGKFAGLKGDFDIPAEAGLGFPVVGKFDFGVGDIKNLRGGLFADAFMAGVNAGADPSAISTVQTDVMAKMTSPIDGGYDSLTWTPMLFEASGAKLTISKIEQKIGRDANGVATSASSPRTTIAFTSDAAGGQLGQLAGTFMNMVGYPTVELYGETDASFDPATDTTRYKKYTFGLTDGFDIQMTAGLQGLKDALTSLFSSIAALENPPAAPEPADPNAPATPAPAMPDMSGLEKLKVVDFDLTLTDKSFVTKMFALGPMMGAQDPEALRNDIVSMISSMGPDLTSAGLDASIANELTTAISNFIKQPGTLHIVMKPAAPTQLVGAKTPLTKAALGFSATSTPGAAPAPAKPK
jgi:hypothetical protein